MVCKNCNKVKRVCDCGELVQGLKKALFFACAEVAFNRYKSGDENAEALEVIKEMKQKAGLENE